MLIQLLPTIRMGNGLCFASCHAGRCFGPVTRFTRGATVSDLLVLLMLYKSHRFFSENINLIRSYFKNLRRAEFSTVAASIALVCIDDDKPVAGTVFKTIVGNHFVSNYQ